MAFKGKLSRRRKETNLNAASSSKPGHDLAQLGDLRLQLGKTRKTGLKLSDAPEQAVDRIVEGAGRGEGGGGASRGRLGGGTGGVGIVGHGGEHARGRAKIRNEL